MLHKLLTETVVTLNRQVYVASDSDLTRYTENYSDYHSLCSVIVHNMLWHIPGTIVLMAMLPMVVSIAHNSN